MHRLAIFAIFLFVAACKFDAGVPPTDGTSDLDAARDLGTSDSTSVSDTASDTSITHDMARDTQTDLSISDVSQDASDDLAPDMPDPLCDGVVRDLQNDPDHCGRCDNRCDRAFGQCVAGACECPGQTEACGANNRCTDLDLDPNNCGRCGSACDPAQWCIAGGCVCREGYKLCNGVCVDIDSDPNHCGDCNVSCGQNACGNGQCRNSANCGISGWTCDQPNTGPACVNDTSELHCAAGFGNGCGTACDGDEVCYDPGFGSPRRCYQYRPAIVCTECPCSECANDEQCIVSDVNPGEIYCLEE